MLKESECLNGFLDKRNFDSMVYVFRQIKLMFDYKLQGRRKINMFMKTRNSKREEEKKK